MVDNDTNELFWFQDVCPPKLKTSQNAETAHGLYTLYVIFFFFDQTIGISYFYSRIRLIGGYRQTVSLKDASRVIGPKQPRSSLSCPAVR